MEPSYLKLHNDGILSDRVEKALKLLESCGLCPRECGINRTRDEEGYCKTGRRLKVASYSPHFGEESPLVGDHGSGTIFISSCNMPDFKFWDEDRSERYCNAPDYRQRAIDAVGEFNDAMEAARSAGLKRLDKRDKIRLIFGL